MAGRMGHRDWVQIHKGIPIYYKAPRVKGKVYGPSLRDLARKKVEGEDLP